MPKPANWHKENGFEFALFPAKTEKPDSLIIYMHGIGDNAQNADALAAAFQAKNPGADVISLQGPLSFKHPDLPPGTDGYAWFPFGGKVLPQVKTLLSHAFNKVSVVKQVENFARAQLDKRGLTFDDLAFTGNSMGAITALQVAFNAKSAPAAVAAMGGAVPPLTRIRKKPEVFLQMGEWDEIFSDPAPAARKGLRGLFFAIADRFSLRHGRSAERLQKKNVPVQEKIYPMQGHILDGCAWADGADFIAAALKKKKQPKP